MNYMALISQQQSTPIAFQNPIGQMVHKTQGKIAQTFGKAFSIRLVSKMKPDYPSNYS